MNGLEVLSIIGISAGVSLAVALLVDCVNYKLGTGPYANNKEFRR